ncbi:ABC transporter ATP-binding protein [Micrococcales bacterium 31B]|nr:ABC transporter ATP-binding protein [Micrococcales bacterium 31B]
MTANTGLFAENLSLGYPGLPLLEDATFAIEPGEIVALMGRSGSGKSTLLWCLLGLIRPLQGQVSVQGERITGTSERKAARIRREHIGVVFQQPQLVSELTPTENVMIPLLMEGATRTAAESEAQALLEHMGVPSREKVTQLSGGEQQRVAVARALVTNPKIVIADEPTAALDEETALEVIDTLFTHAREKGAAVLLVTHSGVVAERADRRLRVVDRQIIDEREARPHETLKTLKTTKTAKPALTAP